MSVACGVGSADLTTDHSGKARPHTRRLGIVNGSRQRSSGHPRSIQSVRNDSLDAPKFPAGLCSANARGRVTMRLGYHRTS
jgi:hypothetical protein